ncbi:MAG: cation-translocating P-type ATPase [Armatimonadota bacterium]|nr:cation-translocating P-type ATPase [Armatimonadota bacterium]MDR5703494.1 cation-translocating P-type ATPase [Armatimonadota bacterium]
MAARRILEVPIEGMDCRECTLHVRRALAELAGVKSVEVFLSSQKAVLEVDPELVDLPAIRRAVEQAGYRVPEGVDSQEPSSRLDATSFVRSILTLLGMVFGAVLFIVVVGEWLGLLAAVTERIPWPAGFAIVLLGGYPVFWKVLRAALRGQILAHTLMSVGALAAVAVGEWAAAAVVVFFMHVGEYVEKFTAERARRAVKELTSLAPQVARVLYEGTEKEVPISEVSVGDTVIVRPGEKIPVDGEVTGGHATVDQSAITGESMPVEVGPGAKVFAATLVRLGSLQIRTTRVGQDTTFGRVIKMVEKAEAHRAEVQRIADKFSAYYLPVVAGISFLTFLIRRDPLAAAAVLVVACSCSFALATPIAMLASIGASARRGILIKGGRYLESLVRADTLLVDKTGTLTLGRPEITEIVRVNASSEDEVLALAASAERYSEHPLAEAVRRAARARKLPLLDPETFESFPGFGVRARVDGHVITVGSRRMVAPSSFLLKGEPPTTSSPPVEGQKDGGEDERADFAGAPVTRIVESLESQGKTLLYVTRDGELIGILAAADTIRPEVPRAIEAIRELGLRHIELLTGDNERVAASIANSLGVRFRGNLLPEDKIAIVKEYQAKGQTVVMIGDGINDAPALSQADVGIAMGGGTDVAIEAAPIVLMRDDWTLVPEVFQIARRTMRVVGMNIAFTAVYNMLGLSLAAFGYLPLVFAAAAQSIPDIGILLNSSRLLRYRWGKRGPSS